MSNHKPIDVDRCNELFEYRDGHLIWKVSRGKSKKGNIAGVTMKDGYIGIGFDGRLYKAHRLVWCLHFGDPLPMQIDHINHNRSDNRIENLRLASSEENQKNQSRFITNKSGTTGVVLRPKKNRYEVNICVNKNNTYLGMYKTIEEAIEVRKLAEIAYGYHPNHGS